MGQALDGSVQQSRPVLGDVRTPAGRKLRSHRRQRQSSLTLLVISALALLFLAPFVWLFITALKATPELAAFPIRWLPARPQWDNFVKAVTYIDFWHEALNSLFLSTLSAALVSLSSALVGFGFARLRGRGKRMLFLIMLSTLMLPPILTIIPTYVLFANWGLIGTYWPWVLWGAASAPFLSFLFRQFFAGIPRDLEDAAIVDGCGYGRIFWQIFLPLSRPVIATAAILSFTATWGDYFTQALFLNTDNTTLAVGIANGYLDPANTVSSVPLVNVLAAGAALYIAPVLLIFFFAQRAFVRGIVTSGIKG